MALTHPHRTRAPGAPGSILFGGGTDGNEQLTAVTGSLLLVLLAVIGLTIVRIGQLLWLHLFLGLLLIGPVGLKLASTGYRFVRYYTSSPPYRQKGPPHLALRGLAPLLVVSTVVVFVTGVILLLDGPASRSRWLIVHKVSFIVWLVATAPHVLGHLLELPGSLRAVRRRGDPRLPGLSDGEGGRAIAVASAIVGGLVLAIALLPHFSAWTSAHFHHHHHA